MSGHIQMMSKPEFDSIAVSYKSLTAASGRGLGKLLSVLDNQGVAVVTGVITPEDVATLESSFADDLRGIVNVPAARKKTMKLCQDPLNQWNTDTHPLSKKAGAFATDFGLPHGKCAWGARMHPNVKKVYELIFSTEDLCVGMDNVFFNPNGARGDPSSREDRLWPHADQNCHLAPQGKYDCYQGVLYLWDSDENGSATVVWPGSNRSVYPKLMEKKGRSAKGHFVMLESSDFDLFVEGARRVPVPAGGLLLWSSKTIHQGWSHGKRLAVPVCFEPSKRRSEEALKSKMECCLAGLPTTHWASLGKPHSMGNNKHVSGGTDEAPLVASAHEHLVSGGVLDPRVQALL